METTQMVDALADLLTNGPDEIVVEDFLDVQRVDTFEEVGLLTMNDGIVLRLKDGSEFQITIVRSRKPSA